MNKLYLNWKIFSHTIWISQSENGKIVIKFLFWQSKKENFMSKLESPKMQNKNTRNTQKRGWRAKCIVHVWLSFDRQSPIGISTYESNKHAWALWHIIINLTVLKLIQSRPDFCNKTVLLVFSSSQFLKSIFSLSLTPAISRSRAPIDHAMNGALSTWLHFTIAHHEMKLRRVSLCVGYDDKQSFSHTFTRELSWHTHTHNFFIVLIIDLISSKQTYLYSLKLHNFLSLKWFLPLSILIVV